MLNRGKEKGEGGGEEREGEGEGGGTWARLHALGGKADTCESLWLTLQAP